MLRRFALVVAGLSLCGSCFAQESSAKVDLKLPAMPLSRLVPELAKKLNMDLRVSPTLAGDVLLVRVKRATAKEVMDRIAEATLGEWRQERGAWTLASYSPAEKRQRTAWLAHRSAQVGEAIRKLTESPEYRSPWTIEQARQLAKDTETAMNPKDGRLNSQDKSIQSLMPRSPGSRAIIGLLAAIGPQAISEATADGRAVFATNPTRLQRAMPASAQAIVSRFFQEQTQFVEATQEFLSTQPQSDSRFSISGVSRGEWRPGNPRRGVGKAMLSVAVDPSSGGMTAALTLMDPAGVELTNAFTFASIERPEPIRFDPLPGEKALGPSAVALEVEKSNHRNSQGMGSRQFGVSNGGKVKYLKVSTPMPARLKPLSPDLLESILHPDVQEPMALTAGALLMGAAEARDLNLVAWVGDDLFVPSLSRLSKGVRPSEYLGSADLQTSHEILQASGWVAIRPRYVPEARRVRISRPGLARLLQSVSKRKLLTLDDISQFTLTQNSPMAEGQMDLAYLRTLNPAAANSTYEVGKWYVYKLYGSLTPGQKETLASGGALPLSNLTPAGQSALTNLVLRASTPKFTAADGSDIEPYSKGIVQDWTQLLPDGVLRSSSLRVAIKKDEGAYAVNSATGAAEIQDPVAMATQRFISQTPGLKGDTPIAFDRYAPATLWKYDFTILLGPGLSTVHTLNDGTFDDNRQLGSFDSLPSAFRDKLTAEMAELKEFFGNMDFTGKGGNGSPPPLP